MTEHVFDRVFVAARAIVDGTERPCVIGRQPFGRIAIANSDAGARAYTDVAIDQAYRAVEELVPG